MIAQDLFIPDMDLNPEVVFQVPEYFLQCIIIIPENAGFPEQEIIRVKAGRVDPVRPGESRGTS